jgi:hypothetical protein
VAERARRVRIATVGLNPSRLEFFDRHGREFEEGRRRFETLHSLGVEALDAAPEQVLRRALRSCYGYFHANPYRQWFDQLERVLRPLGVSYYEGSACHLDLVQWATDPKWGDLLPGIRTRLLAEDVPFLREQLRENPLEVLLLNGSGVIRWFSNALGVRLAEVAVDREERAGSVRYFAGRLHEGARVIGWSTNLQSSFGVTAERRRRLSERVAELVANRA